MKRILFIALLFVSLFAKAQNVHTITADQSFANQKGNFSIDLIGAFSEAQQSGRIGAIQGGFYEFDILFYGGLYHLYYSGFEAGTFYKEATTYAGLITASVTDLSSTFTNGSWPTVVYDSASAQYYVGVTNHATSPAQTDIYKSSSSHSGFTLVTSISNWQDASIRKNPYRNEWMLIANTPIDQFGNTTHPSGIWTAPSPGGPWAFQTYTFTKGQREDWHNNFESDPMVFANNGKLFALFGGNGNYFTHPIGIVPLDSNYKAITTASILFNSTERWENASAGNPVFLQDSGQLRIFYNEFYLPTGGAQTGYYGLQYLQARHQFDHGVNDSTEFIFEPWNGLMRKHSPSFQVSGTYNIGTNYIQFTGIRTSINKLLRGDTVTKLTLQAEVSVDSLFGSVQRIISSDAGSATLTDLGVFGIFINTDNRFAISARDGAGDNGNGLRSVGPVIAPTNYYKLALVHADSVTSFSINGAEVYYEKDKTNTPYVPTVVKIGNDTLYTGSTASGKQFYGKIYRAAYHSDNLRRDVIAKDDPLPVPQTWDADFVKYSDKVSNANKVLTLREKTAMNQFILDLKAASIYTTSKIKQASWFIGMDSVTFGINIMDTTTARISWSTGMTAPMLTDSRGVVFDNNNTNSYGDSHWPFSSSSGSSMSLGYYSTIGNPNNALQMGANDGGNHVFFGIGWLYRIGGTGGNDITNTTKTAGFYLLNRTTSSRTVLFYNSAEIDSNTSASTTSLPTGDLFIGGNSISTPNTSRNNTDKMGSFYCVGVGLTNTEAIALSNAVTKAATTLGIAQTTDKIANPYYISGTATLDFASTSAGASTDLTILVNGVSVGQSVILGVPAASTLSNGTFTAWVSAANTVTVRFTNTNLVSALDPASGSFTVKVIQQ